MERQHVGRRAWSMGIAVVWLAVTAATAAPESKRIAVEYKRDPKARAQSQDDAARAIPDVPDDLKVAPKVAASKATSKAATTGRRTVPGGSPADPESLGSASGDKMAIEAAREWGWRQYWRAGFHRGLRDALSDPHPGTWERGEGFRYGRLDPAALALGGEIAQDAARQAAAEAASAAVRAEFTDLTRQPRPSPGRARAPSGADRWLSAGPWAMAPVFDDVFVALPFVGSPGLSRDARAAYEGWNAQPAVLARNAQSSTAYEAAWKDAGYAFSIWRDRQRPGSYWSHFGPGERDRFRTAFFDRFNETLESLDLRPTYAGYRVGYADGWRYGVAVNAEWNYRQGYAEGFDDGVRASAALSFPFLIDRAYAAAYDAEYRRWSDNAVPSFLALRVIDENDDGVVEPGEGVRLLGEILNYGGAPGSFDVHVDGTVLAEAEATTVRLPARSRTELEPITLRVSDRVAPRTQGDLTVAVADERESLPIYVSRPLEIEGRTVVDAEPLAGRARLVLTVANRSRKPLRGEATLSALDGASAGDRTDILSIPAGGTARMESTYDGIRPLDLLGGVSRWHAEVHHDGITDDAQIIEIAPASTNLADPDLVTYMLELARMRQPPRRDIAEARALMLDRMRADWDRACAASGNPYKVDEEEGSAVTALGELVRAVGAARGTLATRDVFAGLGSDISALASNLPGAHPLLRKWMKRLAKRVG